MELQTLTNPSNVFVVAILYSITFNWKESGSIDNLHYKSEGALGPLRSLFDGCMMGRAEG